MRTQEAILPPLTACHLLISFGLYTLTNTQGVVQKIMGFNCKRHSSMPWEFGVREGKKLNNKHFRLA